MGLRGVLVCVLVCALAVLNTNKAVEIEDGVLKQLLNTPAVVPTKGGYYIFVPSKNSTENANQNTNNQLAGPNSNQNSNSNNNQGNPGATQNNVIIVVPPNSNTSPSGNGNADGKNKPAGQNSDNQLAGPDSNTNNNQGKPGATQNNLIIVVPPNGNADGNNKPADQNSNSNENKPDTNNDQKSNSDQNKKPADSNENNKPSDSNENEKPADSNENEKPADSNGNDKPSDSNENEKPADSNENEKPADSNENEKPADSNDAQKPSDSNGDNDDSKDNQNPADSDKKSDSNDSNKPDESDQNSKEAEDNKPPIPECCKAKGKKTGGQSNASEEKPKPASDVKPLIPQSRGVNRASAESQCTKGLGVFDGPTDQASVDAMKKYNIDIVRIPLNQDCWLALNEFSWGEYFGEPYRKAVNEYVRLLRSNGIKVILDLHWSDGSHQTGQCGDFSAKCEKPMPDSYNTPNFWKSVANQFKDDESIIFDLFNNPYPDWAIGDNDLAWKCWRDGGNDCFSGIHYNVAGMQDLVNAVRETGANNHVMLGGLSKANDLSKWEQWLPKDPNNKIIASWHSWDSGKCNDEACWDNIIAPLAKKYPLIAGEVGNAGCNHDYTDKVMAWLDKHQISYLGWSWKVGDCAGQPALVSDYNGTPTEYGKGILNHIANGGSNAQNAGGQDTSSSKTSGDASDDSCVCPPDSASDKSDDADANKTPDSDANQKPADQTPATKPNEDKPADEKKPEEPKKKSLRGVNRSSFEYSCVQNLGTSEGPLDDAAVEVMKTWNIDIVRVPLNEDCWLGMGGHNKQNIGDNYKKAVEEYVRRLRKHGLKVIIDLHWTDGLYGGPGQGSCYDVSAKCQKPMPDMSHAPRFWKSVATLFKDDEGIIFDIFNEPFPDMVISDKTQAWKCLRDGGKACSGFQYEVAGMQDLVNAVRKTGAKNQIMTPGITWTNDLSRWLEFLPNDPANNLAASWHSYDFNACNNQQCWDSQIAPVAAKYPVYVGEIGEHGCSHGYVDKLMPWLDSKNINYLAWTWNNWDCSSGPALISDYNGTPTNFGVGIRDHYKKA